MHSWCHPPWGNLLLLVGGSDSKMTRNVTICQTGILSMPNMTGRPGYRTMEMNGGSSTPYLARTPCVPLFTTLFNWWVPNPPLANPRVAERAPWRSTKRGVTGVSCLLEIPTDSCHFPCSDTLVRPQYSLAWKALSATRGLARGGLGTRQFNRVAHGVNLLKSAKRADLWPARWSLLRISIRDSVEEWREIHTKELQG